MDSKASDSSKGSKSIEKNTLNVMNDQIRAFSIFRGEHSRLDSLLANLETIMDKYKQESAIQNIHTRIESSSSADQQNLGRDSSTSTSPSGDCDSNKRKIGATSSLVSGNSVAKKLQKKSDVNEEETTKGIIKHPAVTAEQSVSFKDVKKPMEDTASEEEEEKEDEIETETEDVEKTSDEEDKSTNITIPNRPAGNPFFRRLYRVKQSSRKMSRRY